MDSGDLPHLPGLVGALVHACATGLAGRTGARPRGTLRRLVARPWGALPWGARPWGAPAEPVLGDDDPEQVARTVAAYYPATGYPAVVLGSPHGSAAHLAVALGAPWLPAAFDVTAGAPRRFVRWRRLPAAYARFLDGQLRPGAAVVLVRDPETIHPEFGDGLRGRANPLYRITFHRPEVLSAAVADLYRRWLRAAGKTGDRLAVECGRLLDPWQVLRAGLVPYWLPAPSRHALAELHWWLAGSQPFSRIEVLVEPPGIPRDDRAPGDLASLSDFAAAAGFARVRGTVDERGARAYPEGRVPPWRAGEVLRRLPYDRPVPPRLAVRDAMWLLGEATEVSAMILH